MPTTISNQATLQYTYGSRTETVTSNVATTVMQDAFSVSKSTLENVYQAGGELTYLVNLINNSASALTDVAITDNLGTYSVSPTLSVTPLFYEGPAQLYIDGTYAGSLTPSPGINSVTFSIASIPAGSNALLIYRVNVDDLALLATGSSITNTVAVTANGIADNVSASHTIPVDAYADVQIVKTMSPNPVMGGGELTYLFTLYNYGNTTASNVVLTDTFTPAPGTVTVNVNGISIDPSDYTYTGGILTLPSAGAAFSMTVPAATFEQNTTTGVVTVTPGTAVVSVTGAF